MGPHTVDTRRTASLLSVLLSIITVTTATTVTDVSSTSAEPDPTSCQLQLECLGSGKVPGTGRVRIPVRSAQGPPGPPGERGLPGPRGPAGRPSSTWLPTPPGYQVAFHAGLSRSIETRPPGKDCLIAFDSVLANLGAGYNNSSGHFTAPVAGVYIFLLVVSAQSYEKAGVTLLHNGRAALVSWCESTLWATVTNQAILEMQKGDRVWLQCRDEAFRLHGYMYSSLSGYLLYPATD